MDISEELPHGRVTFINFKTKVIEELVENHQFYDAESNDETVVEKGE